MSSDVWEYRYLPGNGVVLEPLKQEIPHVIAASNRPVFRYYTGWYVRHYNTRWRTYTRRTLAEVLTMIDVDALRSVPERLGRPPRVLDVACGTGHLAKRAA